MSDRLVLGTAALGLDGRDSAFALLDEFYRLGGRTIDTAWVYSDWVPGQPGRSETTLGEWMTARGNRDSLYIVTKGAHPVIGTSKGRLDPASIRADVDTSLKRLGTDRLDAWLVHKDDRTHPVPEVVETLQDIHKQGKILAFGCSNWKVPRIERALAIPGGNFTANQVLGNVFGRLIPGAPDPTNEIVDAAMFRQAVANDLTLYLYSATAHGYFERRAAGGAPAREYDIPGVAAAAARVEEVARRAGVKPSEMILATLLQLSPLVRPIIGARSVEQLRAAWKGGDLVLPPEIVRQTLEATGMADFLD
jgi:aryl-alcohol dehydrogenase-like predicted oxidoreductase